MRVLLQTGFGFSVVLDLALKTVDLVMPGALPTSSRPGLVLYPLLGAASYCWPLIWSLST